MLPGARAPESYRPRAPAFPPGAGLRILLVEDDPDSAEALRWALELHGHRVEVAGDGLAALAAARAILPDVLICDLGLPGLSGLEVGRRLAAERTGPRPALLALSGYSSLEDAARSRAAGFDHHIGKPVPLDELLGLLAALAGDGGGAPGR